MLLECPHDMAAGFPPEHVTREREQEETEREATVRFWDLVFKVPHCLFCFVLGLRMESWSLAHVQGEGSYSPPLEGKRIREFGACF